VLNFISIINEKGGNNMSGVKYIKQCKVCNSKFRNLIESLHNQGMNPQKIQEYLQNLTDPLEQEIVQKESINHSSIRRHMKDHFDVTEGAMIKIAETQSRIEKSRDDYKKGVKIIVDNVNLLCHAIQIAYVRMEELDSAPDNRKHQYTNTYLNTIRGLITDLAKLTGDLKQEGTIDINFFSNEITRFADIVMSTIQTIDKQLGMENKLMYAFGEEFKKQWDSYQVRQEKILDGELSPDDGKKEQNVNTFNDSTNK
jgi:hypothetical protein